MTMTEAQGAVSMDRLPWLPDEPPVRRRSSSVLPWALGATALVGAGSYWLGMTVTNRTADLPPSSAARPSQTIPLPQPRPAEPQRAEPIEPVVAAPIAIVEQPEPVRRAPVERVQEKSVQPVTEHALPEAKAAEAAPEEAKPKADEGVPALWPVRSIDGASGRLVRIGAFGSVHQAKRGWWAITKVNPALKRLPALVVPVQSLRNGRTYYRLQMGTTSQAHSAVLCQRMRMIAQSCVVIGLDGNDVQVAI